MILYTETGVSGNLWSFLKGIKPLVLYDVDWRMVMVPMQEKFSSSQFDLWCTEIFCIPEVTSLFFSSCDSVVGDSLEVNQANRGSLYVWLGKRNYSARNAWESSLISRRGGSLMGFLELRQELGYILQWRRGCPFETGVCSANSGHLSPYDGQLRNVN